jgi:hypothetical protein
MEQMTKVQKQLNETKDRERKVDFEWEERMRAKEIGLDLMLADVEEMKESGGA